MGRRVPIGVLASSAVAVIAAAPAAWAADASDWAGAYGGLVLGGKWTDATWTTTRIADPPASLLNPGTPDASSPATFKPSAWRLGALGGYNWRSDQWVYGAEVDLAWSDRSDDRSGVPGCTYGCFAGFPGPGSDRSSVRSLWDGSVRGRLGYLASPTLLIYATGGVAWQRIEVSATCETTFNDPLCTLAPPFAAKSQTDRHTLSGWTLGAGFERQLTPRWLLRAEYRYARFGSVQGVLFAGQPAAFPGGDAIHYDVAVRTHTASAGLVYKF